MSTKQKAADARMQRKDAAQRLIDQSATITGKISIVTGTRQSAGKLITVKFRPDPVPKLATN